MSSRPSKMFYTPKKRPTTKRPRIKSKYTINTLQDSSSILGQNTTNGNTKPWASLQKRHNKGPTNTHTHTHTHPHKPRTGPEQKSEVSAKDTPRVGRDTASLRRLVS